MSPRSSASVSLARRYDTTALSNTAGEPSCDEQLAERLNKYSGYAVLALDARNG